MHTFEKTWIFLFLCWLAACDSPSKHPAAACGDGILDPGEACDGDQLSVLTCNELGYYGQVERLRCNPDCTFDLGVCTEGRCGDGIIQSIHGEDCDGDELAGQTCQLLGLGGGTLQCASNCRWDVSGCEITAVCGDGVAAFPYEVCDGENLQGASCESLGYYGGVLQCAPDCRSFDDADCREHGKCGDGILQAEQGETCDGTDLQGASCESLGYHGGELQCASDCQSFDDADCQTHGRCGDFILQAEGGEECDGSVADTTCFDLGYSRGSGPLSCRQDCTFDCSNCIARGSDAELADLHLEFGALNPPFDPAVMNYTASVLKCVSQLGVTAVPRDPWANVRVLQGNPVSLLFGNNTVTIQVTAEDGFTQKNYSIVVNRKYNNEITTANLGTFRYVPAGSFQRDADPANVSRVSAFWMSADEISRYQWTTASLWSDPSDTAHSKNTSHPVQNINWYQAIAFCNRLSLLEGLTPVYHVPGVDFATLTFDQIPQTDDPAWDAAVMDENANGYRLPTEMEWMWAAMGADLAAPGQINTTGYTRAFAGSNGSDPIQDYVIFGYGTSEPGATAQASTSASLSLSANELEITCLSGNVHELTWDAYDAWPAGLLENYRGPASGATQRVRRGGAWDSPSAACSLSARAAVNAWTIDFTQGLHLVRNIPPGTCP